MLNRDELLPAEQENPAITEELRNMYRMKPEEKQVLARVHQHLIQNAQPLPLSKSVQTESHVRRLQLIPAPNSHAQPARLRPGWLQRFNALAAILFIGLLVGSLVFTFAIISRTRVVPPTTTGGASGDIRVLLVPAAKGIVPPVSQADLAGTRTILAQRFSSFGLSGFSVDATTVQGQPGILVELPSTMRSQPQIINILTETGVLAFWNTGDTPVNAGVTFDPAQYTRYNPGGKPPFSNQDFNASAFTVTQDSNTGQPEISGIMQGQAISRFQAYTASQIGHYLTITLDGKVLESAVIVSPIVGQWVIAGNFTQQQINAQVAILKSGPLPVALKQVA
jgi:hypothetical protein